MYCFIGSLDESGFFLDIPIMPPGAQRNTTAENHPTSTITSVSPPFELDNSGNIIVTLKSAKDAATQTCEPHFSSASGQS